MQQRQARTLEAIMSFFFGSRDVAAAAARGFRGSEPSDEDILADIDYLRRAAGSPRGMETHLQAFGETDVRQVLPGIQVPTLIMHGTESIPYSIGAQAAVRRGCARPCTARPQEGSTQGGS